MAMREKLYRVLSSESGRLGYAYDIVMMIVIVVSLFPLCLKETPAAFDILDKVCAGIFILDYLLRWLTADYHFGKHTASSFLRYPFSPMAIVDLLSILPSLTLLYRGFKLLRLLRMLRAMRVFRAVKLFRYSKNAKIIVAVFRKQKEALSYVLVLALGYIVISALVVFNVEPDTFSSFFDAIYWATVSLTTMGYGDIYPVTTIGRVITMISSLFGIAIIALPAGIITAGYMDELHHLSENTEEEESE